MFVLAVMYECIKTVVTIYPNSSLIQSAAKRTSSFVLSKVQNLKYLGIKLLSRVADIQISHVFKYQPIIIECLENSDEAIRFQTFDLLCKLANKSNVEIIVPKMLKILHAYFFNEHQTKELMHKIAEMSKRYAPTIEWYLDVMNEMLDIAYDFVPESAVQHLLEIIAEGSGASEEYDKQMRKNAVEIYTELSKKSFLPDKLIRVIAWILGEYGYLSTFSAIQQQNTLQLPSSGKTTLISFG